jgi:hypothetical protein
MGQYSDKELRITKADLNERNEYKERDIIFDGTVVFEANLGWVKVLGQISAKEFVISEAGSGIEAGEGIKAGGGIEAGWGIKAGGGIEAGWGIKAGEGIEAGLDIEAGEGIKAGWGIISGLKYQLANISAKWISAKERICAGFRQTSEIKGEIRSGELVIGTKVN